MSQPPDKRQLHQLLVIALDVDADPAARVEAADVVIKSIYAVRRSIDKTTAKTLKAMLNRAMNETRAELKKAQTKRTPEYFA
jgi:hypothetical protein